MCLQDSAARGTRLKSTHTGIIRSCCNVSGWKKLLNKRRKPASGAGATGAGASDGRTDRPTCAMRQRVTHLQFDAAMLFCGPAPRYPEYKWQSRSVCQWMTLSLMTSADDGGSSSSSCLDLCSPIHRAIVE